MQKKFLFRSIAYLSLAFVSSVSCKQVTNENQVQNHSSQIISPQCRQPAAASSTATEATLEFSAEIELTSTDRNSAGQFLPPDFEEAKNKISFQLFHLFGPMEQGEKHGTLKAAPRQDPLEEGVISEIQISQIPKDGSDNVFVATYKYTGAAVVGKGLTRTYEVLLPFNPDTIYSVAKGQRSLNPCVDPHYQSEGDFWYFWSPAPIYKNCRLRAGLDYQVIQATLTRKPPGSRWSYPEYDRLAENGVIDIHMLFGKDEATSGNNPYGRTKDRSAENYVEVNSELREMGFTFTKWEKSDFPRDVIRLNPEDKLPHVEVGEKDYDGTKVRIRMFYGQSEIWNNNHRAFHYFFRDAVKNAAILIYDGHSGLGSHLDPKEIRKDRGNRFEFRFNTEKYQIFFLNSCSSYSYYNSQYLAQKKTPRDPQGTKNLDLMLNGLSTDYSKEPDLALIQGLDTYLRTGKGPTYQSLAEKIDTGNLFIVIGDEDNSRSGAANSDLTCH